MKSIVTPTTSPDIYKTREGEEAIKSAYRQLLGRWLVPAQHCTIPTGQGETFVISCGPTDGPPVVLLHGSGANAVMWTGQVATWARYFRIYAIDIIGEPGLSATSRPPLNSDAYAAWLDEVFDGLALTRTAIVATSFGGGSRSTTRSAVPTVSAPWCCWHPAELDGKSGAC